MPFHAASSIQNVESKPGWWFGTCLSMFPIILGMSSSQLTNSIIFQRGGSTTNQWEFMELLITWRSWDVSMIWGSWWNWTSLVSADGFKVSSTFQRTPNDFPSIKICRNLQWFHDISIHFTDSTVWKVENSGPLGGFSGRMAQTSAGSQSVKSCWWSNLGWGLLFLETRTMSRKPGLGSFC